MKILLIEDDQIIANLIKTGMKEAGYIVEHAPDGATGLSIALYEEFDGAIIDLMLPKLDGLSIIEKIRQHSINLPVIILSAKYSIDDRIRGLQRGGDDYLVKSFAFSELLARTQALIRRANQTVEASSLNIHDLTVDLLSRTVIRAGQKINLQPKEFALLAYLMRNTGHVVSITQIMERVWDYNFDPNTNLVEARICRLREKIDKDFDVELIHTVRGMGYVLRKDV